MPEVKSKKVNWFVKHKILSVIIILLLFMFILASASSNKPDTKTATNNNDNKSTVQTTEKKETEPPKQIEPEIIYNLSANANAVSGSIIEISGTSNLPDKALLNIIAERRFVWQGESEERSFRVATSTVSINNGVFNIQLTIDDNKILTYLVKTNEAVSSVNNNIHLEVIFDPQAENQPSQIVSVVGANGEKLENSPQKDVFGSLTKNPVNRLNVEMETLLPFLYPDQLPR